MKTKLLFVFLTFWTSYFIFAQNEFITTWQTYINSQSSTSITIPTIGTGYNYDVDWENDGVFDDLSVTGNITHDYGVHGTYTVAIRGDFPRIYFNNSGDNRKILSIEQWGNILWTSMESSFRGCLNLEINAFDEPDLTIVTNMGSMFEQIESINQDINGWDVSNVTNMAKLFKGIKSFNQPIDNWNVGNVTNMLEMFHGTSNFNQDISNWDVSSVINMNGLFTNAQAFNQNISSWNVGNVTEMRYMFSGAKTFNMPIGNWNVSSVTDLRWMFYNADDFNQPIGNWNVSAVTKMAYMFYRAPSFNQPINNWNVSLVNEMNHMFDYASSFDQPIGSWNVSSVKNFSYMFKNAISFNQNIGNWDISSATNMGYMMQGNSSLSVVNYDALLNGWSTLSTGETQIPTNISFYADLSSYCNGEDSRTNLINTYGWTIVDNGLDCTALAVLSFEIENIEVYPNPSAGIVYIKNINANSIEIYDVLGKQVYAKALFQNENKLEIDLSTLNSGLYLMKINNDKGIVTKRVVLY